MAVNQACSAGKRERWFVAAKRADFRAIAEVFGIDPVTARIIRNRDVVGEKEIFNYLHASCTGAFKRGAGGGQAFEAKN